MADQPLLVFPAPELASRSKGHGGPSGLCRPSHSHQGARLSPKFDRLQADFEARAVELTQTTTGIDPEQVLVIETIGGVDEFANAVKKIQGLEWMGELELEDILPDEDFYEESNEAKKLSGRLYLIMTNQRALSEMLSLWRRYKDQDDSKMKFDQGLTKFREVFKCLKDIRRWGIRERIEETGVLDAWRESLQHEGTQPITFEAELWFRNQEAARESSRNSIEMLVSQLGGQTLSSCTIPEISYHSLLLNLPRNVIQSITDHPDTELVKCDNVMFFRPTGQMCSDFMPTEGDLSEISTDQENPSSGNPIVALFDGLPLENHRLLANHLIVDDPDDWASDYPADGRVHGTTMASLIIHGDKNSNSSSLLTPLYVRPIMKPYGWDGYRQELMPDDILPVDLIHRAVRRLFEGNGSESPVAPEVKIINLSIGDPVRQFDHSMSPLARLLDWLSEKYNIIFVISAGNHDVPINLGVTESEFENLSEKDRQELIVQTLLSVARNRRILSPAESINSITVGATHHDFSQTGHMGVLIDPYETELPSPISPIGAGYRRSIKPDLMFSGGRQFFQKPPIGGNSDNISLETAKYLSAPGILAAYPGQSGELTKTAHTTGTSNAAALMSRNGTICYESLMEIFNEQLAGVDTALHRISSKVNAYSWL